MFYVSWTRTKRLFVPSLLIVSHTGCCCPASVVTTGRIRRSVGLFSFYPGYLTDIYSITTWNHLCYIAYILVYTLLLLPVARLLSRLSQHSNDPLSGRLGGLILLMLTPHMLIRLTLDARFLTTHNLTGD